MNYEKMRNEINKDANARRFYEWLIAQGEDEGKALMLAHRRIMKGKENDVRN